jgi:serine/threonine-protein kinase
VKSQAAEGIVGNRYLVDGQLGQGGMARVFDAFDERLQRRVAVKILHPHTEALPGMRQRFQQEARIAARLVHPNIVAVLDYGEDADSCYLVMERLPGHTFRDEMAQGPLRAGRVGFVVAETLDALAAAHRFGVLHRDIKPSNILLQEDEVHIKITDFGIAKSFDLHDDVPDDVTQTGIVLGTPGYLAPERRSGHPATVQSDLYAVGAVMAEALSGRRPGDGTPALDTLPSRLRDVAAGALASDPSDRFESAEAMRGALEAAQVDGGDATVAATVPLRTVAPRPVDVTAGEPARTAALLAPVAQPPAPSRRWTAPALVAIGAGALLLLAIVFLLVTSGGSKGPPASANSHRATHHATQTDPERQAIRSLATSLADGGLPGDTALASALQAAAAQPLGAARQAAAEQALVLGSVLLAGGGISDAQFQDVVSILQPTGATAPTTVPPTTQPAPAPPGQDHHGHGDNQGGG